MRRVIILGLHEVPRRVLEYMDQAALANALVGIARLVFHLRGSLAVVRGLDHSPLDEHVAQELLTQWELALDHHGWFGGPQACNVRMLITTELKYMWWHRECHVRRDSMHSVDLSISELEPLAEYSDAERAFGRALLDDDMI